MRYEVSDKNVLKVDRQNWTLHLVHAMLKKFDLKLTMNFPRVLSKLDSVGGECTDGWVNALR